MMAREMTTQRGRFARLETTPTTRRFRLLFDLEGGVAYGGAYECDATDEQDALAILNRQMPGANRHVKSVCVLH